ncbi:hypothetical protein HELRODRAFT_194316 [Helobdella robusta]|uniref:TMEM248/TMEM219 domain-containing protein n=1 Tax=Helobdella robusta TaxID=6412 RepID=T1FVX3_HELRO|nr:hypothetical protein HELRODRAFT_194316 [Helobdella robusta]ESN92284.1 hypothetical protein HELRODRAFT_194316 [Helobdella robusta]
MNINRLTSIETSSPALPSSLTSVAEETSSNYEIHYIGASKRSISRSLSSSSTFFCFHSVMNFFTLAHLLRLLRLILQKIVMAFAEMTSIILSLKSLLMQSSVNLVSFCQMYPPAILFMINIALFAVLLTSIGFYVKVSDHVDSTEEWRSFLESFSKLELCIVALSNTTVAATPDSNDISSKKSQFNSLTKYETHSIPISLSIRPTQELLAWNSSILHLSTLMSGKHIGLEGDDSQAIINVTLLYKSQSNASLCNQGKLSSGCPIVENVVGCVQFKAPRNIFPENKHLQHCPVNQLSVAGMLADELTRNNPPINKKQNRIKSRKSSSNIKSSSSSSSGGNSRSSSSSSSRVYYGSLNWQMIGIDTIFYCRNRPTIRADFNLFLLKLPANVIDHETRQHLFRTSFFLASFVVVIVLYGACSSHHTHKNRTISSSSES